MGSSLTIIGYTLLAYIVVSYIRSYISERRFQDFARANGCEEPKRNSLNKLPWGLDGLWRVLTAFSKGQDLLDDLIIPRYAKLGSLTNITTGLFGRQIVDTIEPRNIQALLATNFKDFETGEVRAKQFGALMGKNIFTSDGAFWAHSRAMFRPVFNREMINDLEETDRACRILIDVLPKGEDRWTEEVNLLDHFYRFTLDTATAFLFGQTTDSQLAAVGRLKSEKGSATSMAIDQEFSNNFTVAQEWMSWRVRMQGLYWLVQAPKWWNATKYLRSFVNHYVQPALESQAQGQKVEVKDTKYNLLKELAKECKDPIELRDQVLGILGAGRDTTAALLGWLFVELALNPKVYTKLRNAIIDDFGTSPSPSGVSDLSFTKLKSCRYLQFCLNETLRLHPPVPVNNRTAARDTTLPVGGGKDGSRPIAIQKGRVVNFVIYAMQRRKDLWGEDANDFKPERWDGRKIDWGFVPFSGGPRICLGQQYAITEASFLTVRLLQEYDAIEWHGELGKIAKAFTLVMYPYKGVPVRLHKAHTEVR